VYPARSPSSFADSVRLLLTATGIVGLSTSVSPPPGRGAAAAAALPLLPLLLPLLLVMLTAAEIWNCREASPSV
jgi:hypothetical protein